MHNVNCMPDPSDPGEPNRNVAVTLTFALVFDREVTEITETFAQWATGSAPLLALLAAAREHDPAIVGIAPIAHRLDVMKPPRVRKPKVKRAKKAR